MTRTTLAMVLACCTIYAQSAGKPAKFEVAAIKPSAPGGTPTGAPGGFMGNPFCAPPFGSQLSPLQYVLLNCTVRDLVGRAWDLRKYEFPVPADPAWISTVRYDITAKSATPVRPLDHERMLQPLLQDRFGLKWHREKKEVPVYYISVAKGGVKLPATKPGSCTAWDHKGPPPPPDPKKLPTCDYPLMPGTPDRLGLGIEGTGVPMESLAHLLTGLLGRPVVDKTGLTGIFDLHFKFARDSSLALATRPDEPAATAPDPSGLPSIFTAIRSLGLNIESGKGPVDVFVIDSVQRPSEN